MIQTKRLEQLYAAMEREAMEQLIISDPAAVNYLYGKQIRPGERMLVLLLDAKKKETKLVISKLFLQADPGCEVIYFDDTEDSAEILSHYVASTGVIGVDKNWPARFLLRLMELRPGCRYVTASRLVDELRQVKSKEEQQWMIEASQINDQAMEQLIPLVSKGYTEKQLADKLLEIYQSLGSEGFSFYPICCYGANAADPHHDNDDSLGKLGDSVILDIGCTWKGYCSDMTRTVFLGEIGERQRQVYKIVKEANRRAIACIRPGVRFCDIDAAARAYITEQGYGANFVHRTGHNIGQEVHEYSDVSAANTAPVAPGMIFSIEPGIYLPGEFGVRIEDLVLVTEDGCQVLNHYSKDICSVQ